MDFTLFLSLLIYTFITAITPGPNNILALNAVMNFGIKKTKGLIFGIYLGFFCVMFCCGFFSNLFVSVLPTLMPFLKYFGIAYIFYLSFKVATSKPTYCYSIEQKPLSFLNGFLLQFINIKIILYGITIFVTFVFPFYQSLEKIFIFVLFATFVGWFGTSVWIFAGVILQKWLQKYYRIANTIMAFLLILSALQILQENLNVN